MRDLSKKEEELRQRIYRLENSINDNKWKRVKKTFFILSAIVYVTIFVCNGMNCVQEFLWWILVAPIFAGILMFISVLVTLYIADGAMKDEKAIARLQGELDAIQSMKFNLL